MQHSSPSAALPPPSPRAISAADDLVFEELIDACDRAASYAVSAREAAFRGSRHALEIHIQELLACVVAALEIRKMLSAGDDARQAPQEARPA